MWDLRWVLAGLGVLLLVGVYLVSAGFLRHATKRKASLRDSRQEPRIDDSDLSSAAPAHPGEHVELDVDELEAEVERATTGAPLGSDAAKSSGKKRKSSSDAVDRVIALRLAPKTGDEIPTEGAVLAMRALGLQHGRYGIFHHMTADGETRYSIASLTEPGSFDLTKLADSTIAGLSVFMVLPGPGDPVERFDAMIAAARDLAQRLGADLLDERGSSWSIQRERYIREEIIEYRYQLEHA